MKYLKRFENINIPIKVGDVILGGRFKNKRLTIKKIGKNAKGDITVNGKPLLKYRLVKESIESFEDDTMELLLPIRDMGMQIQFLKWIPMLVRIFTGSTIEYFDWKSIEADVQTYVSYMTEELGYIFNSAYYILPFTNPGLEDNSASGYKRLQIEKEDISEGRIPEKIKMIAIEFTK